MKRAAFHLIAAGLLVVVVAIQGLQSRPKLPDSNPQAQLIALMSQAGFQHLGSKRMVRSETILSFGNSACLSPVDILYLPAINHISDDASARVTDAGGTHTIVHDGEIVASLDASTLLPRWAWRRLLVALGLMRSRSWQSTALAVLDRDDCIRDQINWQGLTADTAR